MELHLLEELGKLLLGGDAIELKAIGLPPEDIGADCLLLEFPHPFFLLADRRQFSFCPLCTALPIFHITFSI